MPCDKAKFLSKPRVCNSRNNKKSAESDVAPAGIKSYKVENLEYWLAKFYLNLSIISQDIDIERISFLPINQGQ